MKKLIANWKMNGDKSLIQHFYNWINHSQDLQQNLIFCPSFIHLDWIKTACPSLTVGAQDCSQHPQGAFTGDVSASQLADLGVTHVILGHSERYLHHQETEQTVNQKAKQALSNGITPIICVGESKDIRDLGQTLPYLEKSIKEKTINLVGPFMIAYEPLWAIGTGLTPTVEEIQMVHDHLRFFFKTQDIFYGGSVTENNMTDILKISNVDGVLIGGASLNITTLNVLLTKINEAR